MFVGVSQWRYKPWITADIIDCDGIRRYLGFQLTLEAIYGATSRGFRHVYWRTAETVALDLLLASVLLLLDVSLA